MERTVLGGSLGWCRSGPGVHPGCAFSSCSVRSCRKAVDLAGVGAGVGAAAGVGAELLGWAVQAEGCPGVGGVNVGGSGIVLGLRVGSVLALVNSYLEFFLRRLWSPAAIGVVRSNSSLLLLASLEILGLLCSAS